MQERAKTKISKAGSLNKRFRGEEKVLDEYMKDFPTRINLMHFSHLFFHQGKTWCLGAPWPQRGKGWHGHIKSERWVWLIT